MAKEGILHQKVFHVHYPTVVAANGRLFWACKTAGCEWRKPVK